MKMVLDNLILIVPNVTFDQYNVFISEICRTLITTEWDSDVVKRYEKHRAKEYHYNAQIGNGGGAIYIGYQHNSEKANGNGFSLKIEFNPEKETKEQIEFSKIFSEVFEGHTVLLKGGEVALDIKQSLSTILPISLTGRCQDRHKGTVYFGSRGKHGYLKIYDKKKELKQVQNIEIADESLTRIEFSFRFKEPLAFDLINLLDLQINDLYKITIIDLDKLSEVADPIVKACIYSYQNGFQDIKEFTRTYKNKIKKTLESMEEINLDQTFQSAKKEIISTIKKYKFK